MATCCDCSTTSLRRFVANKNGNRPPRPAPPGRVWPPGRPGQATRSGSARRCVICTISFPKPNEYLDDTAITALAYGVRALQARRRLERSGRAISAARSTRAQTPTDAVYPTAGLKRDPLVERRQGRGDRRIHQGRRSVEVRVGIAPGPGRAAGATGGAVRRTGSGRRRSTARQLDHEAS